MIDIDKQFKKVLKDTPLFRMGMKDCQTVGTPLHEHPEYLEGFRYQYEREQKENAKQYN